MINYVQIIDWEQSPTEVYQVIKSSINENKLTEQEVSSIYKHACIKENIETIKYIESLNINIDVSTNMSECAWTNNYTAIKYIIDNNLYIDDDINDSINIAALLGNLNMVKYINRHTNFKLTSDSKPLYNAMKRLNQDVIDYLFDNKIHSKSDLNLAITSALEQDDLGNIKKCVEAGVDPSFRNNMLIHNCEDADIITYLKTIDSVVFKSIDLNQGYHVQSDILKYLKHKIKTLAALKIENKLSSKKEYELNIEIKKLSAMVKEQENINNKIDI